MKATKSMRSPSNPMSSVNKTSAGGLASITTRPATSGSNRSGSHTPLGTGAPAMKAERAASGEVKSESSR